MLRVFAEVHGTKKSSKEVDDKILLALKAFEQLEVVSGNWQAIFGMLSAENQQRLLNAANQK